MGSDCTAFAWCCEGVMLLILDRARLGGDVVDALVSTTDCMTEKSSWSCLSMYVLSCSASMFAWWYPACCIVGPQMALSCFWAAVKCFLNCAQVLALDARASHSPRAFSKSLVLRITVNPMSKICCSVYAISADLPIVFNFSIGLYSNIIGSAGWNNIAQSSVSFALTSSDGTLLYVSKRYCRTSEMSALMSCVSSSMSDLRYFSSIASWIWCCRGFSTFLHSYYARFWSLCTSRRFSAVTWLVPARIVSGAGNSGALNAVALTVAYSTSVSTNPKYPWSPPPKSDSTLLALAWSSCFSRFSDLLVGVPWIGVGVLYLK